VEGVDPLRGVADEFSRSGNDSTSKTSGATGNSALLRQRVPRSASRPSTISIVTLRLPSLKRPVTFAIVGASAIGSSW
jgi:hypothetical protein